MPLYVFATLIPKPEHAQAVEAEIRAMVAATRTEPGNRRYDLFRQTDGAPGLHLFEIYDDEPAFDAHRTSPYFTAFKAKAAEWLAEPPVIRVLTAIDAAQ